MKNKAFIQKVDTYSINFLWLNIERKDDREFISQPKDTDSSKQLLLECGFNADESKVILNHDLKIGFKEKLFTPVINWAKVNKEAEIKIWYDSEYHSKTNIENSENALAEFSKQEGFSNVHLHDIRTIEVVKNNPLVFSKYMPLYARIDFLKLIINYHELKNEHKDGAIVTDITALKSYPGRDELFSSKNMEKLEEYGILRNDCENQFIQFCNDENILFTLEHVINIGLKRTETNFDIRKFYTDNCQHVSQMSTFYTNFLYMEITDFPQYYISFKEHNIKINAPILGIESADEWINYDPTKHKIEAFGNYFDSLRSVKCFLIDYTKRECYTLPTIIKFDKKNMLQVDASPSNSEVHFVRSGRAHTDKVCMPDEDFKIQAKYIEYDYAEQYSKALHELYDESSITGESIDN